MGHASIPGLFVHLPKKLKRTKRTIKSEANHEEKNKQVENIILLFFFLYTSLSYCRNLSVSRRRKNSPQKKDQNNNSKKAHKLKGVDALVFPRWTKESCDTSKRRTGEKLIT